MQRNTWIGVALFFELALLVGCGGLTGADKGGETSSRGGQGTMRVLLTDAPFPYDLVEEANVTITGVEAQSKSEGRVVLTHDPQSFNLLELRDGITDLLAAETLPAGTYDQLRLTVSDTASVVLKGGRAFDLKVPSGAKTGIKIKTDSLTIQKGETVELTLDFAVDQSFVMRGNPDTPAGIRGFIFKPVVHSKGHTKDDDDDGQQELEGEVEAVTSNYLIVAGRRFEITSATKFDGFEALSEQLNGRRVEIEFIREGEGRYRILQIDLKEGERKEPKDDDNEEE